MIILSVYIKENRPTGFTENGMIVTIKQNNGSQKVNESVTGK